MKIKALAVLIFLSIVAIDQFLKYKVRLVGGFYVCNKGIAFGINISDMLFWILWWVIMFLLVYFILKNIIFTQNLSKKQAKWLKNKLKLDSKQSSANNVNLIWLVLIFSGAISNTIDRRSFGCILDFIDIKIFNYPLFNIADIFIFIGVMIAMFQIIKNKQKQNVQ